MDEESLHVRYLVVIAAILCALIIGYNAFYVPDVSMTGITVSTDVSSLSSEEEYTPQPPASSNAESVVTESSAAPSSADISGAKININTATEEQLSSTLDGIGDVMAKRIIDYRNQNGGFKNIDELKNVPGIGDKTFEKLKNSITVG